MTASAGDVPRELRMYVALKRIAAYSPPDKLRKTAEADYGLSPAEAIEMAYENVLQEAKAATRGMRPPKPVERKP